MRTDYFSGLFDGLPPAPVTHVTHRQIDCVTENAGGVTRKNSDLAEPLRMLRMLRAKPDNTGNETGARKNTAYRFKLHNGEGGGTYISEGDLETAHAALLKHYGLRLALVVA